MGKSFFDILQIISRDLKISAESRAVAGVLGSLLEFVPEIFWEESVHDLVSLATNENKRSRKGFLDTSTANYLTVHAKMDCEELPLVYIKGRKMTF